MKLLPLITPRDVQARLNALFPSEFSDRSILVGAMSARVVFVALYGGFIAGTGRYFRPSTVTDFSDEQAALTEQEQRVAWFSACHTPWHRPLGSRWYKVGSRESIRDDLMRNRMIPLGILDKLEGVPANSPKPVYFVARSFAALFAPSLNGPALDKEIANWRRRNLNPLVLKRMALLATGVASKQGEVDVTLPGTGKTLRLSAGQAAVITKDVCEVFAAAALKQPVVVHISFSDRKFPELSSAADALGLKLDPSAELPDVVIADVGHEKLRLVFVEVVHSDGAITALRARSLLRIAKDAGIAARNVLLVSAFEDRASPAFRRRFSELAVPSRVWFRSEPHVLLTLDELKGS